MRQTIAAGQIRTDRPPGCQQSPAMLYLTPLPFFRSEENVPCAAATDHWTDGNSC
jgi:hypothetical protein